MKAFLLAAGVGSRLRPITDNIPKCLVPVNGKPLLDYWMELFEQYGIDHVLINTHYLAEKVESYVKESNFNITIELSYEDQLLGSAGTIIANRKFVESETAFLICYADNLTNINLKALMKYHNTNNSVCTLGVFKTSQPEQCGIVEIDQSNRIISFEEKPAQPKSNLAAAGLYVAHTEILNFIPEDYPVDFGFTVLPKLVGNMQAFLIDDYFIDIGSIENYEKAQTDWARLNKPVNMI